MNHVRGRLSITVPMTLLVCAGVMLSAPLANGQTVWDVFQDGRSESACGIVNTVSSELVVLQDTAQLMIVSRTDIILTDTFVDAENFVFFEGEPFGLIDFADDGDGFRTLWWLTFTGHVVELNPATAEPLDSTLFPEDFNDVPCNACNFVDVPPVGLCTDDIPEVPIDIGPILNLCGAGILGNATLAMTFCGLLALRTSRRRM